MSDLDTHAPGYRRDFLKCKLKWTVGRRVRPGKRWGEKQRSEHASLARTKLSVTSHSPWKREWGCWRGRS